MRKVGPKKETQAEMAHVQKAAARSPIAPREPRAPMRNEPRPHPGWFATDRRFLILSDSRHTLVEHPIRRILGACRFSHHLVNRLSYGIYTCATLVKTGIFSP